MTLRLTLAAMTLALAVPPAMAETTWSGTGPRGGTAQGTVSCSSGDGRVTCQQAGSYANPAGQTWKRSATRVGTADSVTVTGTTTGPRGQVSTVTRTRTR